MKLKSILLFILFVPLYVSSQISIKDLLNEKATSQPFLGYGGNQNDRYNNEVIYTRELSNELKEKFQNILDEEYGNSDVAGLSASVIVKNSIWKGVAGISSTKDSLNSEMVLGIGSLTKSIAAATILKLEEEGVLSINDKISRWLEQREYVDSNITIKQLLNHTSGVYNVTENPKFITMINSNLEKIWKPDEVLDSFLLEPYYTPGSNWHYSNSGYIIIGMIIESATGKSFHEIVREKILKPNNLDSIYLKPQESNSLEIAHFWVDPAGGSNAIDLSSIGIEFKALFSGAWAAGAYMSRTSDITKWMKALASGDVLSEESQLELLDGFPRGNNGFYGLGVGYLTNGEGTIVAIGHSGNIGYTTQVYHFLDEDLTLGIQCNDATIAPGVLTKILTRFHDAYLSDKLSINQLCKKEIYNIYPNPVSNTLFIDLFENKDIEEVTIYNELGIKVNAVNINKRNRKLIIDISHFESGIYFIKIDEQTSMFMIL